MDDNVIDTFRAATDATINELKNGAFWTDRRDAAEALTDTSVNTVTNLKQLLDDPDIDVRTACRRCFDRLRSAMDMPMSSASN